MQATAAGRRDLGDVIVGIDDTEIHQADDLFKALDYHKVGDIVDVTVDNKRAANAARSR